MNSAPFAADRYELRPGHPDAVLIAGISALDARQLGASFAAIDPWASYPYPAEGLVAYLGAQEAGAPRLLLRVDGEIAGAVGLRLNWLRGPYLQFLGVLPNFQRRGLGSTVLEWFERETRNGSDRNLCVAASDFNAGAIRFYEGHGFEQVARLDGLVRDDRAEILMRRRL
jgi:ribosomal protein S18 acetylase RimI-like enzyme